VGPRVGLDVLTNKKKNPSYASPTRRSLVTILTELPQLVIL